MFSPNKIQRKIDLASIHMIETSPIYNGKALFDVGFRLQEHSIEQVAQANGHFEEVLQDKKRYAPDGSIKMTPAEIRWIRNERALCRCSFLYWATRYAFIISWEGELVRFEPNIAQNVVLDVFSSMEEDEIAILVQVLKARQLGVTTLSQLILLWKTIFFPYSNSLAASSRPEKSTEMAEKLELAYHNLPWWLKPQIESYNVGELIGFDAQNSFIRIRHGSAKSGMGRGTTVLTFHLSEVAEFLDPDEQIDAALIRAAHDNPNLVGILESTANGREGWWYDKWNYNVRHWPLKQSRLCPIFLPWYIGRDIYPSEAWLRAHPVPRDHRFLDITKAHAKRAAEYVQSGENQIITNVLGSTWEMPPEQKWFWEVTRNEYAASKKLHYFYQELCADDKEAFQSKNTSIFDAELIFSMRENCPRPAGVYGILAPQTEVPIQHQARREDINPNQAPIHIVSHWAPMQPKHELTLVPLLHRGSAPFDPLGKVIIYEHPASGEYYGLGVDTSYGLGQDRSVVEGIRKGSPSGNPSQVFEYASPDVNAFSLWPITLALGTYYSTSISGQRRQAKVVIEGAANGELVYHELKKRGWREFHNWLRYDRKKVIEANANRQVWMTNVWSRALLMDMLLDSINNGWIDVNSPWLVDELSDLELVLDRQKIMAAGGKHDDRVMAFGMVLYSLHILETRRADAWTARERLNPESPHQMFPSFNPHMGTQGYHYPGGGNDRTSSYNYQVVKPTDPDADILREAGPILWTPDDK